MKFFIVFFIFSLMNFMLIHLADCELNKPYDYYLFQLTWPSTFCHYNRCENRQSDHFVIHGNWPSRFDKTYVNYCGDDEGEDFSILNPIRNRLIQNWPSLKGNDHSSFWEYEYRKHGSCVSSIETPSLSGLANFFQTTLYMYDRLNLDFALRKINFIPTDSPRPYPTIRFVNQLQQFYGVVPFIRCRNLPNGIALLENISFCYDKQLNLINCPQALQCKKEFLFPLSNLDMRRFV